MNTTTPSPTTQLQLVLTNSTIRYSIYGGLYAILVIFVLVLAAIKTYKNEKAKILKRKKAFISKENQISYPAPIHYNEEQLKTIQQRRYDEVKERRRS